MMRKTNFGFCLSCVLALACSKKPEDKVDGSVVGGSDIAALSITPKQVALTVDGATAPTQQFTVTATFKSGKTSDVTSETTFTLEPPTLGSTSSSGLFTASTSRGGMGILTAAYRGASALAEITVVFHQVSNDPNSPMLPMDPAAKFNGAASTMNRPDLLYPNDGVMVPPNLGRLEFHFSPGAQNTIFELSFSNLLTDVKVYLTCTALNAGCLYQPAANVWSGIAETNRGGEALTVTLRAANAAGTQVATSDTIKFQFAADDVQGGIYYWTTTTKSIQRFDFASTTQTMAEKYLDAALVQTPQQQTNCVGCHALTKDGTKMIVQSGGQRDGRLAVLAVDTRQTVAPFGTTQISTFESWNPDGTKFVGVYSDIAENNNYVNNNKRGLMLFDGLTAAYTSEIAGTGTQQNPANHPDWSPDGTKIAYARAGQYNYGSNNGGGVNGGTLQFMGKGYLEMVTSTDGGNTFGAPIQLTAPDATKNRYYPAFAPDSAFLVFNQANVVGDDDDSDTNPRSKLFAMLPTAGATLVELANATKPGKADGMTKDFVNSYPKWAPFVFKRGRGEQSGRLMWLTFASRRKYGLRTPVGSNTLLWMVAIDPDKVASGEDPSATAFCLPFQDLTTSNHIAQWATQIVAAPPIN